MLYFINGMTFTSVYLFLSPVVEEEHSLFHFFPTLIQYHYIHICKEIEFKFVCMTFSVFLFLFMSFHLISFGHPTGADPAEATSL